MHAHNLQPKPETTLYVECRFIYVKILSFSFLYLVSILHFIMVQKYFETHMLKEMAKL